MPLLEVQGLKAVYGDMQALFGIDLALEQGKCLALVGANGAGKSTLLKSLAGLQPDRQGSIRFADTDISAMPAEQVVRLGVAMVPEGRMMFPSLTVEENLQMGQVARRAGPWTLERVYALFPVLHERRRQMATTLSGGQQQMVAVGRALLANPRLLLCDELSLGLAPAVIDQIYASLAEIRRDGVAVIVVEQDIARAMSVADDYVCMLRGTVRLRGPTRSVDVDALTRAYFGD